MKKAVSIILFSFMPLVIFSQTTITSTLGFEKSDILSKDNEKYNASYPAPNLEMKAVFIWLKSVKILTKDNIVICSINYDDLRKQIKDSETIYPIGWSKDSSSFYFLSEIPGELVYIARIDLMKRTISYYVFEDRTDIGEYLVDVDRNIFFYSDHLPSFDQEYEEKYARQLTYTLKYIMLDDGKNGIIDKSEGYRFDMKIIEAGKIQYSRNGNELITYIY